MRMETHPEAAKEAQEAADYYEQCRTGLGYRFESAIETAGQRILNNPYLHAEEDDGTRFGAVDGFPYSIIYEIHSDKIWIAAIAHQRRRPGYWKARQPSR